MKIGFFVPCYMDALYPQAAISTWELLRKLGLDVEFINGAGKPSVKAIRRTMERLGKTPAQSKSQSETVPAAPEKTRTRKKSHIFCF